MILIMGIKNSIIVIVCATEENTPLMGICVNTTDITRSNKKCNEYISKEF